MRARIAALLLIGVMLAPSGAPQAFEGSSTLTATSNVAAAGFFYLPDTITLIEGGELSFTNLAVSAHTLTSTILDENDQPLFDSGWVGFSSVVMVRGVSDLRASLDGYEFYCWLQPWMRGRLIVIDSTRNNRAR